MKFLISAVLFFLAQGAVAAPEYICDIQLADMNLSDVRLPDTKDLELFYPLTTASTTDHFLKVSSVDDGKTFDFAIVNYKQETVGHIAFDAAGSNYPQEFEFETNLPSDEARVPFFTLKVNCAQ